MNRILLGVLFWSSLLTYLRAEDEARIFAEGNKAYQEQDYAKAIKIYEQLLDSGYRAPELEYNLGNAWYKKGSPGRAILHYERALILAPENAEIKQNLDFLHSKLAMEIEPLPPFFLVKWWQSARLAISTNKMGIVGLVLWWLGFSGLAMWILGKNRAQRKWGLLAGIALLLMSILPFSLAISRVCFEKNTQQAILLQKSAILRAEPEDSSQEIMTLVEGVKLQQIENINGWWQVRLENGELGWLPEQSMERI
ncbi:MAG: tetratricopeptide repeat protein [Bacteroidetes bacterium]|nr:tetratricopeptide repeat protein [Bacteroidota bacterium]